MGLKKRKRKKGKYDIETIHHSFTTNLSGLRIFVSNLAPIVKKHDDILRERTAKILEKMFKILGVSKGKLKNRKKIAVEPTKEQFTQIIQALKGLPRLTPHNVELLYKSSFVMLIGYFDFLISDLIHCFYQMYPESLTGKELSITLSELNLCNDLSEAVDYVVNREVDKVVYDNLESQKRYFARYLKIDTKESIIHWNKINEAVERRHIIVHNNSIINRRYLKNIDHSIIPEKRKELEEGKKITINENYFMAVFAEIFIAGIILIQCCWRKWKKDNINHADLQLNESIYDALSEGKWTVAERLGLFSKECEVYNKRNRLYLDINYCQALKWQNKKGELEKELKKFDVSGLSPMYILALSVLKSDKTNFYKNIKKAIITDKLTKTYFMEWPLFKEFRRDPDYKKKVNTAFMSISKKS